MSSIQKWNKNTALVIHNDKLTIEGCLTAPHISLLVSEYGFKEVASRITKELDKINILFGFKPTESYQILFVEFIITVYKFESMNDVVMCLTNGRNGKYGKPFRQLDPGTFQNDWMAKHLEQKSIAREKKESETKSHYDDFPWKTREEYEKAAKKPTIKSAKDILKQKDADYQRFKADYEATKKGDAHIKGTIKPENE